jgi:hypothetical protein
MNLYELTWICLNYYVVLRMNQGKFTVSLLINLVILCSRIWASVPPPFRANQFFQDAHFTFSKFISTERAEVAEVYVDALGCWLSSHSSGFCFTWSGFRFTRLGFSSICWLSFHFCRLRFTFVTFVSLMLLSFHVFGFRFTRFAFVSLVWLSFHVFGFRFTLFPFVSLVWLSFHVFGFRFTRFAFVSLPCRTYTEWEEFAKDFVDGTLHPGDVKPALTKALNSILQVIANCKSLMMMMSISLLGIRHK